ncbi:DNA topoisomerase VI [Candidatus Woesearchaeota archaeon CG_4_10_14_0_8_um_filter_47_5]|nr:MAG: DNA topoisomerase VI [Candidatus Woesearchaeota archaeon CG_4_10_14_0_8_um_filter_47_5]
MKKDLSHETVKMIEDTSRTIYDDIISKHKPKINTPIRSLSNVVYDPEMGYFELSEKEKMRTLTVNTIKTFAQTLRMLSVAKEIVNTDDIVTKREMYYISKNWGDARFKEQPESDTVMEDIEGMFHVNRERLGFIPEEKGGDVYGRLTVIDTDPDTKNEIKIDCTKMGSGSYSVPSTVEELEFETKADFVLAIETAGMYQRLVKHAFWKQKNCVLISMGGVPTRACRRFIRRLSDSFKIPVYAFTDGDPYGWLNIYRTLKVGSGNAAHINKYFCVPETHFFGITAQDIIDYQLPTHPLSEIDIKRIKDGIKNDPFVQHHKKWQKALDELRRMKVRAEQQALAKHGLNFVISDYLPAKLENPKTWLP